MNNNKERFQGTPFSPSLSKGWGCLGAEELTAISFKQQWGDVKLYDATNLITIWFKSLCLSVETNYYASLTEITDQARVFLEG